MTSGHRRWWLWAAVVVLAAFLAATAVLFLFPATNPPERVDAIVALGGDKGQLRAKEAVSLGKAGYSHQILVSLGGYPPAPCPAPVAGLVITCFRADPLNTRGEAEEIGRQVVEHHWQSVIVVPSTTQVTRARIEIQRCTSARLVMVPVADPKSELAFDVLYEWGALAKALVLVRTC